MKAQDVMISPVVTVRPTTTVREIAKTMVKWRISAVPVVDEDDRVVGIISEGDLLRRAEIDTEKRRSWWLQTFTGDAILARDYAQAHAHKAADIMTEDVITVKPATPLSEIALLMETRKIKRVPVVENGMLVGIVSRANLVQALAAAKDEIKAGDRDLDIRRTFLGKLRKEPWAASCLVNATVKDGVVDLWGITPTEDERNAIRIAAESLQGVRKVNDHLVSAPVLPWI